MESVETGGEGRNLGGAGHNGGRGPGKDGQFFTTVNGLTVKFTNPNPKGGHMLEKAGFEPAGDFALIQLLGHSTRLIGLDDEVDLRGAGTEAFRAFKTYLSYRFLLNDHCFGGGAHKIAEGAIAARRGRQCRRQLDGGLLRHVEAARQQVGAFEQADGDAHGGLGAV